MNLKLVAVILCCYVVSTTPNSMPSCEDRNTCDFLWKVPELSDCINRSCQCTGDSEYVEELKTCYCKEGYVKGSNKCLKATTSLFDSCNEDVQCSKMGAVCVNYQCVCKSGTTPVNNTCWSKKYIGDQCDLNDECHHIKSTECKDKICVCANEFVPHPDGRSCLPIPRNFWSPCMEDVQCHRSFGEGSRCLTKCVCKNAYHKVNDSVCVLSKDTSDISLGLLNKSSFLVLLLTTISHFIWSTIL